MKLLYKRTRDGTTSWAFHNKCDFKGSTICLYKNDKGYIFGGFTSVPWVAEKGGNWYEDNDSFIFTLTNIHGTEPTSFHIIQEVMHFCTIVLLAQLLMIFLFMMILEIEIVK